VSALADGAGRQAPPFARIVRGADLSPQFPTGTASTTLTASAITKPRSQ